MSDQRRRFSMNLRLKKTLLLGLATATIGLLLYFLPFGLAWEENVGLDGLYKLRDPRLAPADVVLVSIDKGSADQLGLANDPARWPRGMHARLIDQLADAGAAVVVFDIFFKEPRDPAQDQQLSDAARRAGNVVLFAYLKREVADNGANNINIEHLVPPFAELAQAAAAIAPFALPKVPVRISQFWTFHTSAGDVATLPVAALERYSATAVTQWLQALAVDDARLMKQLLDMAVIDNSKTKLGSAARAALLTQPALLAELRESVANTESLTLEQRARLEALFDTYAGKSRPYLNLYGPPHTITTVPYVDLLQADVTALARFKDKVVFVGFAENRQPEQKDGFFTVYSQTSGVDVSGVEIAATAFANILQGTTLKTLPPLLFVSLIVAYGFMIAAMGRLPTTALVVVGNVLVAAIYLLVCYLFFTMQNIWLPWVVPLLIQTPLALLISLWCCYGDAHRSRQQMHHAFSHYVPLNVVNNFADSVTPVVAAGQLMYGICLATDAERYTRLAETLTPAALSELMNGYYEALFAPVRARQGIVSDVIGDAMLALWSAPQAELSLRQLACEAALDIAAAALKFSQQREMVLNTRIGLHAGEMMIGNIGALDHYEYRAVGDIVNTASRIQGLNKQLGTHVIASEEVLAGVSGLITRKLGIFMLAGKEQTVTVHELLGRNYENMDNLAVIKRLCSNFEQAYQLFLLQAWNEALVLFQRLIEQHPDDGPTAFYLKRCQKYVANPPVLWSGVIQMGQK